MANLGGSGLGGAGLVSPQGGSILGGSGLEGGGGGGGGGSIGFIGSSDLAQNVVGGGSMAVPIPVGTVDGHTMIMHLGKQNDVQFNAPVGWTLVPNLGILNLAGNDYASIVATRVASSEGPTITVVNPEGANARSLVSTITTWSNVAAAIFDVAPVTGNRVHSAVLNSASPAMTSVTANAVFLVAYFQFAGLTAYGGPSGFALRESDVSLPGAQQGVASSVIASPGLVTPGVWTATGLADAGSRTSLILRPA